MARVDTGRILSYGKRGSGIQGGKGFKRFFEKDFINALRSLSISSHHSSSFA
jgi:hypothetical protein